MMGRSLQTLLGWAPALALVGVLCTANPGESWWNEDYADFADAFAWDEECADGSAEGCALSALQVGRCPYNFQTEVREVMLAMHGQIDTLNNELVVLTNEAIKTSSPDDLSKLVPVTNRAARLLGEVGPKFMRLLNKTNAIRMDPGLAKFGEHALHEEAAMLKMLKFTIHHAGMVMSRIAMARNDTFNTSFASHPNTDAQEARAWLQKALITAWESAKDMLPRIAALVNGSYSSPTVMSKQAACAANTAKAISKLTTLYADIVTAGADCNVSNAEVFNEEDCQSSALNVQSGIDGVIRDAASMMFNCYDSSWVCAQSSVTTSQYLIKSFMSTIVMKDACRSNDTISLAVCKSESFQLLSNMGGVAGFMYESSGVCESRCH